MRPWSSSSHADRRCSWRGELRERTATLTRGVEEATMKELPQEHAESLRGIFSRHESDFRRALRGDLPARVGLMKVHLKPGAHTVRAYPRQYDSARSTRLAVCMAALTALGLVFVKFQAV